MLPEVKISAANMVDGVYSILEESKLKLTCSATGKPEPTIFTWTLPDNSTSDGKIFEIGT